MKRFTLRKVKQHSYSRQGWILKDLGYVFTIYDREWAKNFEAAGGHWRFGTSDKEYKYIDHVPAGDEEYENYYTVSFENVEKNIRIICSLLKV